jgi:hypothetical protein
MLRRDFYFYQQQFNETVRCPAGVQIGDSVLFAITNDTLRLLVKLLDYEENRTDGSDVASDRVVDESEEFPPSMKPLLLAALCGRYETVDFLLNRGHTHRSACARSA